MEIMKLKRVFLICLIILFLGFITTQLIVSSLGWRETNLAGKSPQQVHLIVGEPTCRKMDQDAWFRGLTFFDYEVVGLVMYVGYNADRCTGRPIAISTTVFPDFFGMLNGCRNYLEL
jgi:hypothetical protein